MTFLVQVELREGDTSYVRHVLQDAPVGLEDVQFYYHDILGLRHYQVSTHSRDVPATFTLGLLGAGSHKEIPTFFPAYDIILDSEEARAKYAELLTRICEMERMRAECGLGAVREESAAAAAEPSSSSMKAPSKYKSWVDSILASIRLDVPTDLVDTEADLTPIADAQTIAWVLTPVLPQIRETYGNRIITDVEIGRKWGPMLGTEMWPDIAVCRRLSTIKWRANNSRSAALARAAIEWYIEAQMLEAADGPTTNGISPWIQNADSELSAVLVPFQNLGVRQAFAKGGPATTGETTATLHPVMSVLHRLEEDHLRSALTHTGILTADLPTWERYVRHILRIAGIGSDVVDRAWGAVKEVLGMWVRGDQGVDPLGPPVYAQWQTTWSLLLDDDVATDPVKVRERFRLFVETLDAYDPILAHTMSNSARYELVNKWIAVFVEKEMVADPKGRVVATLLYTDIRNWILKYLPISVADNPLKPMNIGPTLTTMGYLCHKLKKGRMILNLRYRVPPTNPLAQILETGAPAASNVLDIMREEAAKEAGGFVISARQEIHLGRV